MLSNITYITIANLYCMELRFKVSLFQTQFAARFGGEKERNKSSTCNVCVPGLPFLKFSRRIHPLPILRNIPGVGLDRCIKSPWWRKPIVPYPSGKLGKMDENDLKIDHVAQDKEGWWFLWWRATILRFFDPQQLEIFSGNHSPVNSNVNSRQID